MQRVGIQAQIHSQRRYKVIENSATKLIRFLMEHEGFIIWPNPEKDIADWYKLLDELDVPRFEPTQGLVDKIGDFTRFMQLGYSLMGTMESWKEIMLTPIPIKARNGKTYISRSLEAQPKADKDGQGSSTAQNEPPCEVKK